MLRLELMNRNRLQLMKLEGLLNLLNLVNLCRCRSWLTNGVCNLTRVYGLKGRLLLL